MKTAISLPDRVFKEAQRHARRVGKSNSELVTEAVTEYLARHTTNGHAKNGTRQKWRGSSVKSRHTKSELLQAVKRKSPPKTWFDEPAVDLTKPSDS